MIIPFFNGLMSPLRAPMTWALIALNLLVLVLTQINMTDIQERLEVLAENKELSQIQGRIFAAYILDNTNRYPASYQKMAEEALSNSDLDKTELLGAFALRDSYFFSESNPFFKDEKVITGTDSVEKAWWKEKSKEVLLIRNAHAGYSLGITDESQGPLQWLTYQFVHSDSTHFLLNMLVFLFFGAALESVIGPLGLLAVFVLSGLGAALTYLNIDEVSAIPLIGASGSVSGVVALFCILFWNHGLRNVYFIPIPARGYMGFVYVPGWVILMLWMITDLASFLSTPGELGSVAHSAHLGGEFSGLILACFFFLYFKLNKRRWNQITEANTKTKMLGATLKIEPI
jgi:membrane associated rhomboid family serine protease